MGGLLVFGLPLQAYDCGIKNISETGARIRLPSPVRPPAEVWLIDIGSGAAYGAKVSWRSLQEFGLKFYARHELKHPMPGPLLHLRSLWLERVAH